MMRMFATWGVFNLVPAIALAWPCPDAGDLSIPLPEPAVVKACRGDLDADGKDEVVVGVVRATPKDGTFNQRLFVYTVTEGVLVPKFLGTRGTGSLTDFGLYDIDKDGRCEVLAREKGAGGGETRVYKWGGYGLTEDKELVSKAPPFEVAKMPPLEIDLSGEVKIPKILEQKALGFERTPGKVRRVRVRGNLKNVANRGKYRWLPRKARRQIRKNGFAIMRPNEPYGEFHHVYNENQYLGLPSFVTSDVALHLAHLLFDHAVQKMEVQVLGPALTRMVRRLHDQARELSKKAPEGLLASAERLLLRLELAAVILDGDTSGIEKTRMVRIETELKRIRMAKGPLVNDLGIDYQFYKVRGHYTSSEALKRYFRAFMFLSQAPIADPLEASLLTTMVLSDDKIRKTLAWLEGFGTFLVGPAADLTPLSLAGRASSIFGEQPTLEDLATKGKKFIDSKQRGEVLTILARRWPADNDLLENGVDEELRPYPDPLDLLATLGSKRARALLEHQVKEWPELGERLDRASVEMLGGGVGDTASVGGRWLMSLRWLLLDYPKGYASFQRSHAWPDHMLVCAAASWAELRRDTILYVKPPVVWAEGGDEESLPPSRAGFVEPLPELYAELAGMLGALREGVVRFGGKGFADIRGPREPGPLEVLGQGKELLTFLKEMSQKELKGKGLKRAEHETLSTIGGWFENILAGRGRMELDPVPVIADVYYYGDPETGEKRPLLVATGPVDIIVVAVPLGKRVILARGPVYSFYSFTADDPMSDEEWREQLEKDKAPEQPPWARPIDLKIRPRMRGRRGL